MPTEILARGVRSRKAVVALAALVALVATFVVVLAGDDTDHGVPVLRGSGVAATRIRRVEPFNRVEMSAAGILRVDVGKPGSLMLHGDDNLLGLIRTKVEGGTLVISQEGTVTASHGLEIAASTPELVSISLSGAGDVAVSGVEARSFTADLAGAGRLDVDGRATQLKASLTGAGEVSLEHLLTRHATAVIIGAGAAHVYAIRSLDVTVSGMGRLDYRGDPARVTTHLSGTGAVIPE